MEIVADSTLQLAPARVRELGIHVLDHPLFLNGAPYAATWSMSQEEKDRLRDLIADKGNKVTTSGLVATDVACCWNALRGTRILSMHQAFANSRASAAVLEQVRRERPGEDVTLFDSEHLTVAYTVQVLEAAKARLRGASDDEILALVQANRPRVGHLGAVYDLFFLHRSGRLGLVPALLGSAIHLLPILSATDQPGVLKAAGRVRTSAQALARMVQGIEEHLDRHGSRRLSAVIAHCGPREPEARQLADLLRARPWDVEVEVHPSGFANMPHEGPDFFDVGFLAR